MQVFDASSMIYAWDNYPILQFPGLWEWIATKLDGELLVMPSVAYEEVANKAPDCGKWLADNNVKKLEVTNAILRFSMRIKNLPGIIGDSYHSKGVGENDIFIIATACNHQAELVSNEGRQKLPDIPAKMKIPAVCALKDVDIPCINFIEYIKRSEKVFR